MRSTRTEEKPRDVFDSGDKEKLDTFTAMYPNEDEYDNAAAAHDAESADLDVSIGALTRAIAALEKGVADSDFFQSGVGHAIRKVAMSSEKVSDVEPAPPSGDIFRILKQMKDEVSANLADTLKAQEDRKANHAGLVEVRKKEMATSKVTTTARLTWQVSSQWRWSRPSPRTEFSNAL